MIDSEYGFYKSDSPERVLSNYLKSCDTIYDRARNHETSKFLQRHLDLCDMSVLEVGCGGGLWSVFFSEKAASLTCCDIREHVVAAAKLHISQQLGEEKVANINWLAGDIRQHYYREGYNLIFLKDVLEHVEDDFSFLRCLTLLLKPGGYIYIATQNRCSLNYLIEGGYYRIRGQKDYRGWDPTHIRLYESDSLTTLGRQCGLRPVAWHGMYHNIPYRFLSRLFLHRLVERDYFHYIERLLGMRWPFSRTGWAIGVLMKKEYS